MSTERPLYPLLAWLSPAYPVGAYTFSHGIEYTVEAGWIRDADTLREWLRDLLLYGDGQADLVFLAEAWRADDDARLREVQALALAFQPSAEIRLETTAQGTAFLRATAAAWPCAAVERLGRIAPEAAYSVAVGAVARDHGVALPEVLEAYGHAFVANLVSAAVRLVPLGQTDGQVVTASLGGVVRDAAREAAETPLDDVSSSCPLADIAAMRHESQYTRLFRS